MGAGHCLGTSPSATRFPLPAAGFRRVYAAVVAGLSNAASRVAMVRGFSPRIGVRGRPSIARMTNLGRE